MSDRDMGRAMETFFNVATHCPAPDPALELAKKIARERYPGHLEDDLRMDYSLRLEARLRAFLTERDKEMRMDDLFHRIEVQSGASAPDEGEIEPWTEHLGKMSGPEEAPCLVRVRFTAEEGEPEEEVVGVGVVFPWIESDPEMGLAVCAHLVGEKGHSEVVWASEWDLVSNPQVASVHTESIIARRDDGQDGQLAALRQALEGLKNYAHPASKDRKRAERALATDAGKKEGEVIQAAKVVREIRRKEQAGLVISDAALDTGVYPALRDLDATVDAWTDRKET